MSMSHSSNGIPPEGTSPNKDSEDDPSLLLQEDAVQNNKGSEDDPSLLLQDDAVQNVDWVIEGGGVRR
jgi:hypothetical protein